MVSIERPSQNTQLPDITQFDLERINSPEVDKVLGYYVRSTAALNVEDDVVLPASQSVRAEIDRIAKYLVGSDDHQIVISIHGYATQRSNAERDLLPMAQALEMTVTPWSPLANGVLTGKYNQNGNMQSNSQGRAIPERSLKIAEVVGQVAQELGYSASQVALAWIRTQSSAAIPIIGARSRSHIHDNLACLDLVLPLEHLKRLDEVSRIELGFPHDFINSDESHDRYFGSVYRAIDNPWKLGTYSH